jgi:ribonuclease J
MPRKKVAGKKLEVIPLGGVLEIGKNMTAYVYDDNILVVDAGLMFPEEEMLGVDIVIPDVTFLQENRDKVLGIVLTHGHEDHIGALPYVLKWLDVPVFGTALTLGFVANKLEEHGLLDEAQLYEIHKGGNLKLGEFALEFVGVSHSVPDTIGLVIRTPVGTIVHSSDFKFDQTPIDGQLTDAARLARIGEEGVLLALCDVTNVEKAGFSRSESEVGETFDRVFEESSGRVIIAAFASNIHRVQQVYNVAARHGRRVAVVGRSMQENCRIAEELGYLKVPDGTRLRLDELDSVEPRCTVIVTTGSQGEPLSALSRMALDEHKKISISPGDTVIISANPIPGNEDLILRTINRLFKQGADVLYEPYAKVHASGHGNQEDIKLMLNLLKPKYVVPVHGEQRHVCKFSALAESVGISRDRVLVLNPGDVLEVTEDSAKVVDKVQAGSVMVDGLGVGDVEDVVLRDRWHLAQDGVFIVVVGVARDSRAVVTGPDIFTRGFAGEDQTGELLEEAKALVVSKLNEFGEMGSLEEFDEIKSSCRKAIAKLIYERIRRRPVIIPIVMEV